MTRLEADKLIEAIAELEGEIASEEKERDTLIEHYQEKIARARDICDKATREARELVGYYTEQLREYASERVTEKKRSVPLPSGTLSFRKQSPRYYLNGKEIENRDADLLEVVKSVAPRYVKLKTEEVTDWANFKKRLTIVEGGVIYEETGELIPEIRGQIVPDKFTVTTGE